MATVGKPASPSADAIRRQLEKILTSDTFRQSRRLSRFLRYTVEHAIEGESEKFKEFLLGVEVFDKSPSFDPRIDSIVRVEACRLRSRLKTYYETEGRPDRILIEYRKGSYAPVFCFRDPAGAEEGHLRPAVPTMRGWKTIAVLPFADLSPGSDIGFLIDGLVEELLQVLTKVHGLQVVAQTSVFQYKGKVLDIREIGAALRADTVLEGSVRKAGPILRITAQLADVKTGYILWSGNYERLLEDIFAVQEEIAQAIAAALSGQLVAESGRESV